MTQRGAPDEFYLNDGHGHFTSVPLTSDRFIDTTGKPMSEPGESFTLDAKLADLNGDGIPDLYVSNDFEDLDQLWYNDGKGHFRLADWKVQRQTSNSAMGFDVGDINGDGIPDLFEVDMRLYVDTATFAPAPSCVGGWSAMIDNPAVASANTAKGASSRYTRRAVAPVHPASPPIRRSGYTLITSRTAGSVIDVALESSAAANSIREIR